MMFSCVFVTFQCDVLGKVWYLIVSVPCLCLLACFNVKESKRILRVACLICATNKCAFNEPVSKQKLRHRILPLTEVLKVHMPIEANYH